MKFARLTPALAVVFTFAVLAACGGGGGGTVTPPGGGGGGGPTPTPAPSGNPTAGPTATPTAAPTHSPTPMPTQTPTPMPTPTPMATPTPVGSATPSKVTVTTGDGEVNGTDDMFPGGIGEDAGDGDYPNGGHGPLTNPPQTIGPDNVPCLVSMNTNGYVGDGHGGTGYHVHTFLGIFFNGSEVALPDGVGFADPEADGQFPGTPMNWTQYATMCYYETHVHDGSGLIHQESATPPMGDQLGTKYTLGDFLAVWGITISPTNLGPLNGGVTIYTSGQAAFRAGCVAGNCRVTSNHYTLYMGDPSVIGLYSHEVIWILVDGGGKANPRGSSLPNVSYFDKW